MKAKKSKKSKKSKKLKRDYNILLHLKGEINLGTKTVKDKKRYNRKKKHKSKRFDKAL